LSDGLVAVEAACAEALDGGTHSTDVILNILARRNEPRPAMLSHRLLLAQNRRCFASPAEPVATPARLRLCLHPLADCGRYDGLRLPPLLPAITGLQTVSIGVTHGALCVDRRQEMTPGSQESAPANPSAFEIGADR
jgi:hypothetical protein